MNHRPAFVRFRPRMGRRPGGAEQAGFLPLRRGRDGKDWKGTMNDYDVLIAGSYVFQDDAVEERVQNLKNL